MSLADKLDRVLTRAEEIRHLLATAEGTQFGALSKELSDLEPLVEKVAALRAATRARDEAEGMLADPELRELAEDEYHAQKEAVPRLEREVQLMLLPKDAADERSAILEVRPAAGGDEAALFAADLFRMLCRYAEGKRWKVEILTVSEASAGGYKEVVALVTGQSVYSHLRYEAGVHRVQRVPATEAQGRIHTSTATVAVLPEADDVEIDIDDKDLDISIAASGGPGGQGVNTTNSAVQIRHIPTGIIVKCQDERSQLKNKAKAMKVLKSRLLEIEQRKRDEAQSAERRGMVGSAERSAKIRTYNFPQNRITDHRIGLTIHKLERVLDGDLDELISALRTHRQAELLRQGDKGGDPNLA